MRPTRSTARTVCRAALLALACTSLPGCDATALRVLVAGDLAVPDETDTLVVTVRAEGEVATSRYPLDDESASLSESLTLLPGERMRADVEVEVDALKGPRKVAAGRGQSAFRDGAVEELVISLALVAPGADGGPAPLPDGGPPPDAGPRQCDDDDGDGYGDGPGCLGLDCDEGDGEVHPGAGEVCNDIDDDCDFAIDEGCPCDVGESRQCGTFLGECRPGLQLCLSGEWRDCDGSTPPEPEQCGDDDDDDCDGQRDEGCK